MIEFKLPFKPVPISRCEHTITPGLSITVSVSLCFNPRTAQRQETPAGTSPRCCSKGPASHSALPSLSERNYPISEIALAPALLRWRWRLGRSLLMCREVTCASQWAESSDLLCRDVAAAEDTWRDSCANHGRLPSHGLTLK